MSVIQLYSGDEFNFHAPENCKFDIEDIARALSQICRFNGHCRGFYSVAQHSILVAENCSAENQLAGLLHDASEAFVCDLPSPFKRMLPHYKEFEGQVMGLILERYELASVLPREVKFHDLCALKTEARDMQPNIDWSIWSFPPEVKEYPATITPWPPDFARRMFMDKFRHLDSLRA